MKTINNTLAGQVSANIELGGSIHPFVSTYTSATLKDHHVVIKASQAVFSPFRIYTVELKIANGAEPGTYPLDGKPGNTVGLAYDPPTTVQLDSYRDIEGEFTLTETASEQQIDGTFYCTAKSLNPEIRDLATFTEGKVSFRSETSHRQSTGYLRGTLNLPTPDFSSSRPHMSFTEPGFLQVVANDDNDDKNAPRHLWLHIPTSKLGEKTLPISPSEDGDTAVVTLIAKVFYRATSGTVNFTYDEHLKKLTGTLNFSVSGPGHDDVVFSDGSFEITGLSEA
ncbi:MULTISPECIES: DUF6252 family protein [unclassified Pseudomonas]|uniref:DUF6252 family protein n=1 Tax=unclassified Pseudomonas TaxID=196821 RepID=UPI000C883C65|nr:MULTISPECIES: DUF6252 family protein [unclassified Pseudomonas]PMX21614.1 hypothetical protein C1Y23_21305 [Pseudomonas sp. GW460-12]PMX37825.1 hypothetical protein C1Y24_01680 [Pseudomonas sp. MPR-R2A4]PMX44153.1 hypothetical protein C1Y26_00725 [Pseudomonas sp. MPR-R2A7]PMX51826.1 hypothetical protein C1Y17_22015 [Pseudomonas sp. MPR-R2A6]PMX94259.1 hypothetical protein C1Y21_00725 [Pseudomonas sp. MPR-R2A3]